MWNMQNKQNQKLKIKYQNYKRHKVAKAQRHKEGQKLCALVPLCLLPFL